MFSTRQTNGLAYRNDRFAADVRPGPRRGFRLRHLAVLDRSSNPLKALTNSNTTPSLLCTLHMIIYCDTSKYIRYCWKGVIVIHYLPTQTMSVGVGRTFETFVSLYVCLSAQLKNEWSQNVQTWCGELYTGNAVVLGLKGQMSRS